MAQVELDVFSGRPNPCWELDRAAARRLSELVAALPAATDRPSEAPGLGYRGFVVDLPGGRYRIRGTHVSVSGDRRADPARTVERFLVASLPPEHRSLLRLIEGGGGEVA